MSVATNHSLTGPVEAAPRVVECPQDDSQEQHSDDSSSSALSGDDDDVPPMRPAFGLKCAAAGNPNPNGPHTKQVARDGARGGTADGVASGEQPHYPECAAVDVGQADHTDQSAHLGAHPDAGIVAKIQPGAVRRWVCRVATGSDCSISQVLAPHSRKCLPKAQLLYMFRQQTRK